MCFGFSPTLTYCGTEPGYSRCYMPPPYPSRRERALGVRATAIVAPHRVPVLS